MNLYGALGDYERTVRERKYKIAETEDRIAYLKKTLKEAELHNQKLDIKCQQRELEAQMEEARFEAEVKKKSELESVLASLTQEYDGWCNDVEKKRALVEKIEKFRISETSSFMKMEQDYMERYRKMPTIGTLMNLSEQQKELQKSLNQLQLEIEKQRESVQRRKSESKQNWSDFVDICIKISLNHDQIRSKLKEYEDVKRKIEANERSKHIINQGNNDGTKVTNSTTNYSCTKDSNTLSAPFGNVNTFANQKQDHVTRQINLPDSIRSLSIDQRLQLLKRKTYPIHDHIVRNPDHGKVTTMGISRYFKAVEAHEANKKRQFSNAKQPEPNSLQKSIEEIRQRYSSREPIVNEESKLQKLLKGYKSTYLNHIPTATSNFDYMKDEDKAPHGSTETKASKLDQIINKGNVLDKGKSSYNNKVEGNSQPADNQSTSMDTNENCEVIKELATENLVEKHSTSSPNLVISINTQSLHQITSVDGLKKGIDIPTSNSNASSQSSLAGEEVFKVPPPPSKVSLNSTKANSHNNMKGPTTVGNDFFAKITSSPMSANVNTGDATSVTTNFGVGDIGSGGFASSLGAFDIFGNSDSSSSSSGLESSAFSNAKENGTSSLQSCISFDFDNFFGSRKDQPLF